MTNTTSTSAGLERRHPSNRRELLSAALGGATLLGCATPVRPAAPTQPLDAGTPASLARLVAGAPARRLAPTETEGPFPLRAMLAGDKLLRADITEGRPGVPLALRVRLVDATRGCRPMAGAWVYV
jgi:hypothetical protein